jgi:hypothetical protein
LEKSKYNEAGNPISGDEPVMPQPHYNKEDHARRGTDLYEQQVRPQVEAGNQGKVVAIDIDSGAFALGENSLSASELLLARLPDAQIWCVRIGAKAVYRFGFSGTQA